MKLHWMIAAGLALGLGACSPKAPEEKAEAPVVSEPVAPAKLAVQDGWAAITPKGAKVGAGYLTIDNPGEADKLLSAASARAAKVEIHEMSMDGAMMKMRPVAAVDVPAAGAVKLAPGGFHLMFMDITVPFAEGDKIPVSLTFEKAGAVEVVLDVRKEAPAAPMADGMKDSMKGGGQ